MKLLVPKLTKLYIVIICITSVTILAILLAIQTTSHIVHHKMSYFKTLIVIIITLHESSN